MPGGQPRSSKGGNSFHRGRTEKGCGAHAHPSVAPRCYPKKSPGNSPKRPLPFHPLPPLTPPAENRHTASSRPTSLFSTPQPCPLMPPRRKQCCRRATTRAASLVLTIVLTTFSAHKSAKGRSSGPVTVVLHAPLLCLHVAMVALCWKLIAFWPFERPKVGACGQ